MEKRIFTKDRLLVKTYPTRAALGTAAADDTLAAIAGLLEHKREICMLFAAAPSQAEFLERLSASRDVDFSRITAFHMDEYIGLPAQAPQGFGNFLKEHIFGRVPFKKVHYINGGAAAPEEECARYGRLLREAGIDIACMGIGENAHIAFNDPPVADFGDPCLVKVVRLDSACRAQQVNDGCFASLDEVPTHAYTLTVPALTSAGRVFCMVPGKTKARAVYNTLTQSIEESVPASVLRTHKDAALYIDADSAALLDKL